MGDELTPQFSDIIFYATPEGNIHVEVFFGDETFWLSQKRMAELFGVDVRTV
ncbi:MAG TPA: cell filamentation protein Fic, partial [Nitrospirota bacterium]